MVSAGNEREVVVSEMNEWNYLTPLLIELMASSLKGRSALMKELS